MSEQVHDKTKSGTAEDNIPTQSNTMDNIHGNTEDISNKASGYKSTMNNASYPDSTREKAAEQYEKLGGEDAFMKNNNKGE